MRCRGVGVRRQLAVSARAGQVTLRQQGGACAPRPPAGCRPAGCSRLRQRQARPRAPAPPPPSCARHLPCWRCPRWRVGGLAGGGGRCRGCTSSGSASDSGSEEAEEGSDESPHRSTTMSSSDQPCCSCCAAGGRCRVLRRSAVAGASLGCCAAPPRAPPRLALRPHTPWFGGGGSPAYARCRLGLGRHRGHSQASACCTTPRSSSVNRHRQPVQKPERRHVLHMIRRSVLPCGVDGRSGSLVDKRAGGTCWHAQLRPARGTLPSPPCASQRAPCRRPPQQQHHWYPGSEGSEDCHESPLQMLRTRGR